MFEQKTKVSEGLGLEYFTKVQIRRTFLECIGDPTAKPSGVLYEPVHEISNNVVCATSKASDQPAHTRSLIKAFASRFSIL